MSQIRIKVLDSDPQFRPLIYFLRRLSGTKKREPVVSLGVAGDPYVSDWTGRYCVSVL